MPCNYINLRNISHLPRKQASEMYYQPRELTAQHHNPDDKQLKNIQHKSLEA